MLRRRKRALLSGEEQSIRNALTELIQDGRVAIMGPIRQEVLSGIQDTAQFERLREALAAFRDEPFDTSHFEEAARLFNICRGRGVECGPIDILICSVAAEMRWPILTNDQGLLRCMEVLGIPGAAR
jgi:predicted nucleic acid-binding protein